ncbi:hypothetical protein BD310DRAFT_374057 [Dichomitus squalens]|uniref:Uncharacterized protein n=1 Tax=Dichomitus squalens TaxID=114155 RepID=A0A4Q9PYV6_9APHY|nr:hypothetical protein BD310DRAFT_374057 [Dichomitus squalens]
MGSEELPRILEHWYKVPRASSSRHHHVRPQGARKALEEFALECVEEIVDRELEPLCTVQEVCKLVTRTACSREGALRLCRITLTGRRYVTQVTERGVTGVDPPDVQERGKSRFFHFRSKLRTSGHETTM